MKNTTTFIIPTYTKYTQKRLKDIFNRTGIKYKFTNNIFTLKINQEYKQIMQNIIKTILYIIISTNKTEENILRLLVYEKENIENSLIEDPTLYNTAQKTVNKNMQLTKQSIDFIKTLLKELYEK